MAILIKWYTFFFLWIQSHLYTYTSRRQLDIDCMLGVGLSSVISVQSASIWYRYHIQVNLVFDLLNFPLRSCESVFFYFMARCSQMNKNVWINGHKWSKRTTRWTTHTFIFLHARKHINIFKFLDYFWCEKLKMFVNLMFCICSKLIQRCVKPKPKKKFTHSKNGMEEGEKQVHIT